MIKQLSFTGDRGLIICCENFIERFQQLSKNEIEYVSTKLQKRNIVETHSRFLKGEYESPFKK